MFLSYRISHHIMSYSILSYHIKFYCIVLSYNICVRKTERERERDSEGESEGEREIEGLRIRTYHFQNTLSQPFNCLIPMSLSVLGQWPENIR